MQNWWRLKREGVIASLGRLSLFLDTWFSTLLLLFLPLTFLCVFLTFDVCSCFGRFLPSCCMHFDPIATNDIIRSSFFSFLFLPFTWFSRKGVQAWFIILFAFKPLKEVIGFRDSPEFQGKMFIFIVFVPARSVKFKALQLLSSWWSPQHQTSGK